MTLQPIDRRLDASIADLLTEMKNRIGVTSDGLRRNLYGDIGLRLRIILASQLLSMIVNGLEDELGCSEDTYDV